MNPLQRAVESALRYYEELGLIVHESRIQAPSSATHTMIVDPDGNAHYNDYPDKERAPEMYG
jgi:hypothetical protein